MKIHAIDIYTYNIKKIDKNTYHDVFIDLKKHEDVEETLETRIKSN